MKLYCPECKQIFEDTTLRLCPQDSARLFVLEREQSDQLLGAMLDQRFRIESLIGQGGMGSVYLATQLSVGRKVAVKVLRRELVDREVALERFYRESKVTSDLSHPNIVKLIDFGQDRERDLLYLVMELVDGVNLGDLLETNRFRIALALEIVYQVCGALTEPHSRGVIHRDLKPDNLLLVPISDGTLQVKVLDFGIARVLETSTQITATGMVCGTPAYMAPEQAQNHEMGPRTDLYALGVMLYEMLCGSPPFDGQSSLQLMLQHIQITPPPLSSLIPPSALPESVEQLVFDMMAKAPADRPESARAVRHRIERLRKEIVFEPVRLDPDAPRERLFEHLMLAPLPAPHSRRDGGTPRGTTNLRRETAQERDLFRRTPPVESQLAFDETALQDLVTLPARTALERQLVDDASRATSPPALNEASPPPAPAPRHDARQIATPSARLPVDVPRATTPHASLNMALVAGGVLSLIVVALLAIVGIVISQNPSPGAPPAAPIAAEELSRVAPPQPPATLPPPEKHSPSGPSGPSGRAEPPRP